MGRPLRVLMVEDVEQDALLAVRELRRGGFEVAFERVDTQDAMSDALAKQTWDVIISDYSMPRFSALLALGLMKERNLDLPFIIVSGTVGENIAVEALRAGAHDFMVKGNFARLVPAIEREIRDAATRHERLRMERDLRTSEQRFQELFELGPDAIVMTSTEGLITLVNRSAEALFGYSRDELIGQPVEKLIPESSQNGHVGFREKYLRSAAPRAMGAERVNLRGLRKDGTVFPVEISLGPIDSSSGTQVAVAVRDVGERVRLEEQLRQSQKMDAIGRLAGGVAHDFNNLLSVILSYSSMLAADMTPSDPRRADLVEIEAAGKRAVDLTRQLLAFGRQQILQPRTVNLNDAVTGMERMLRRLIGEDVELTVFLASTLGKVKVDPSQMEQIVMNLAVNSRDAMPHGGKLTIETANVELDEAYAAAHLGAAPGPHVMLAVTDTGTGMDKATLARMFEPFFTTKEKGKGTGLGLATVFGIVQQSGGNVWVYSEPGKGTTFKVYFPRTDATPTEVHETTPPAAGSLRGTETILLVEDEESVRVLARTILRRFGYHVIEAQSGGDALLICEQHTATIHLLLTDVVMPRMSGRQLSERLRTIRPTMKVLFMSGYTDNSIVHHGVLDSGVAFLQKPITPETLTHKVREVLSG
jgi:two-component system cell cycle sensor histidine kinase/response regulator CckA